MAWRIKLSLPKFHVHQRASGYERRSIIPRGRLLNTSASGNEPSAAPESPSDSIEAGLSEHSQGSFPLENQELSHPDPSLHEIKQSANVESWRKIRLSLLKAVTESHSMRNEQQCVLCLAPAKYRCVECGPLVYFCSPCLEEAHSKTNIFHTPEVWDDGVYKPVVFEDRTIDALPPHICFTKKEVPLCCVDTQGVEHQTKFYCCDCESICTTMVRARLWPASPRFPQLAFAFELLDWAEALLLECQVAVGEFCRALYFKCPMLVNKRRDIYTALIDAFEEYRYMKMELRHLTFINPELDGGNVCPACPKDNGSVILSMDALFGLPRKKAAGKSHRQPLHGNLFFGDQQSVDEYVATAPKSKKHVKACSEFLAGNALRSSTRYKALDETAVFGCACRHEFPLMFVNLKHGERLGYSVWMLESIMDKFPRDVKLHCMYDIACVLTKHLESTGRTDVLERVTLSLPSFHAYGHNAQCQVVYGPTRYSEIGLSDGEVMERLWSYLRRFSRMTKEMRPAHRIDVLTQALVYYGLKTKRKLGHLLCTRWRRTEAMKLAVQQTYKELLSSLTVSVNEDSIMGWIEVDKAVLLSHTTSASSLSRNDWRTTYYQLLHKYYDCTRQIVPLDGTNQSMGSTLPERVSELDKQLSEFEEKHKIAMRWSVNDHLYTSAKLSHLSELQEQCKSSMWTLVTRRQFLLKLKAKYADGQAIAKKLSKNISKETNKLRVYLEKYNAASLQVDPKYPTLMLSEILSPTCDLWMPTLYTSVSTNVSTTARRDIIEAFLLLKRCEKELILLKSDMSNVVLYWKSRENHAKTSLRKLTDEADQDLLYNSGCICLLKKHILEINLILTKCISSFSSVVSSNLPESSVPSETENTYMYDSSDSSESEDDYSSGEDFDSDS